MHMTELFERMLVFSKGNLHDIDHLSRVWLYARLIGAEEGLDARTQRILEAAAITHDIACPLCREKYGCTDGKLQEQEGAALAREFLCQSGFPQDDLERVVFLVAHHHTLCGIEGIDWQILVEADYLVNAMEKQTSREAVAAFCQKVFKTASGTRLLHEIFCF